MSYLSRNRRGRVARRSFPGAPMPNQPNYTSRLSGVRRHELDENQINTTNLAAGNYVDIINLKFKRTFDTVAPIDPDVEPTPTNGNNFASNSVMNGSKVRRFRKKITIRNNQGTNAATSIQKTVKLDVYELALSFWDAFILDNYEGNAGLPGDVIDFENTASDPQVAEVSFEASHPVLTNNLFKNSAFLQRYYKHRGQISIEAGGQAELNINYVPPQCRRSQSGMFWGLLLLNDPVENFSEGVVVSVNSSTSFEEIPSDERLPFLY